MNINNIVEIIATEFSIYYFIYKYLGHNMNKKFILCPTVTAVLIVLLELNNYSDILFFITYLTLYFLLPIIIIKSKKYLSIMVGISGVLSLINMMSNFTLSLTELPDLIYTLCHIIINLFVILCIVLLSLNKNIISGFRLLYKNSKRIFIVIDIYIWELLLLITALTALFMSYPHAQIATLVSILIVLSMVISFITFFLLISKNMKSIHYQSINKQVEKNIEEQINYYNRLSQYNDDLRKFRHDYKNLQIGLLTQLKEGNIDEAIKFLNDCNSMVSNSDVMFHTGNTVIDSLLFDKLSQVKDTNITLNFNGVFPENPMNTADLCVVFGNLVDNTIEACLKLPETHIKNIEIFLTPQQDYLFISFMNPVTEKVIINNNSVTTTKDNKDDHGIGLYSVKKILKKYDGHLTMSCSNTTFTTRIDFRIKSD